MERNFPFLFCSCLFICLILFSCKEYSRRQMEGLLSEYIDEKICYPRGVGYITADSDIVSGNERRTFYTILNYVDSIGCIGCKLKLNGWDIWVHELDSIFAESVKVIFLCHPMIRNDLDMYIAHDNFSCAINFDIRTSSLIIIKYYPLLLSKLSCSTRTTGCWPSATPSTTRRSRSST